jgi:hypothetical protein
MTDRDDLEVDALITDRYLESLLAARDRRGRVAPPNPDLTPAVGAAIGALEPVLVRVHPSFRFEERLAADLQVAAASQRGTRSARGPRPIAHLEPPGLRDPAETDVAARARPGSPVSRPLLIGGALTSAAISIAGAYVAWRRARPSRDPMVRAVRAAHRAGSSGRSGGRVRTAGAGRRTGAR